MRMDHEAAGTTAFTRRRLLAGAGTVGAALATGAAATVPAPAGAAEVRAGTDRKSVV